MDDNEKLNLLTTVLIDVIDRVDMEIESLKNSSAHQIADYRYALVNMLISNGLDSVPGDTTAAIKKQVSDTDNRVEGLEANKRTVHEWLGKMHTDPEFLDRLYRVFSIQNL